MISLPKPVSKHQISKMRRCMYSFTEKKVYCLVCVPFPIKEKGLYTPSLLRVVTGKVFFLKDYLFTLITKFEHKSS